MSITFRTATAADDLQGPIAIITARQLAAFRTFLRQGSVRSGTVLLDPDAAQDEFLAYHFEARVCPIAFASVARVFDFQTDVISVVEEAQFRSRRVRDRSYCMAQLKALYFLVVLGAGQQGMGRKTWCCSIIACPGTAHHERGGSQYEKRYRSRRIGNLQRHAKAFGFILHEMPAECFHAWLVRAPSARARSDVDVGG